MNDNQDTTIISKYQITAAKSQIFVPECCDNVSDTDCVGIMVAHTFTWDGRRIMEAFASALEDANFHDYADTVRDNWLMGISGKQ